MSFPWINFVGNAIQMTLNGVKKERPLTHDLIGSMLLGLGARLEHVIINDQREGTFYARIFLRMENELARKIVEIDARPSDSIVLALQQKRPIYVARPVFDLVEDMSEILERVLKQQSEEGDEERAHRSYRTYIIFAMALLPDPIEPGQPFTALAPMQDVTDLAFMRVIAHYGAPDYFFTEFFRVHAQSRPERHILRSIDENDTGRPVFAQLIGEDIPHLARTAGELAGHPIAGIDLNLGCPAPKVYRKNVGGGLLRDPERISEILAALREAVHGLLTVKMRLGFDDTAGFEGIVDRVNSHRADLLSVHGRTVREMYRSGVHYDCIAAAAARARCPVLANGNITSAAKAAAVLAETRAAGVMIGRHAIRNPWIFTQIRDSCAGRARRSGWRSRMSATTWTASTGPRCCPGFRSART